MKFKKFIAVLLAVLTLCAIGATTVYAETPAAETSVAVAGPRRIYIHYTKTVVREYTSQDAIPDSIEYEEYDSKVGSWFSGTLHYVSTVKKNGFYYATFTGELYGNA